MTHRQISLVAIVALIAVAAYFALLPAARAPEVRFKTLTGESITTSDLRGKVVLVEFWATSCEICVKEMPKVIQTYNKYKTQGFETIAVAMEYDPPNFVLNYAQKNALPFKVALDVQGDVAKGFGNVLFTPTSFLIDKRGNIVKRYVGAPDVAQFQILLEAKLKEAV